MKAKLSAKRDWEPDILINAGVASAKTKTRKISAEYASDEQWDPAGETRVDRDGLEFVLINEGLTGPTDIPSINGGEADSVSSAAGNHLFPDKVEFKVLLLFRGKREKVFAETILRLIVYQVVTEAGGELSVEATGVRNWLAAEVDVPTFVPVATPDEYTFFVSSFRSRCTR